MENQESSIFIRYKKYPNVGNIFNSSIPPIEEIIGNCIFVLDTNILLDPYKITSEDLTEIKKIYSELINENRLIIPGQVARKFVDNRPEKLKNISHSLKNHQDQISEVHKNKFLKFSYDKYPLLYEIPDYVKLTDIERKLTEKSDQINEKIKTDIQEYNDILNEYKASFSTFKKKVDNWNWRDPISLFYSELFDSSMIVDYDFKEKTEEQLIVELNERFRHSIPPGYKDKGKDDKGIGDLIIWFTILQIAEKESKDIILVSGDEKNDWFMRSDNKALYPRFELINEFRERAPANSFSIISWC